MSLTFNKERLSMDVTVIDLLSAALNESGVQDDLDGFPSGVQPQAPTAPSVATPVGQRNVIQVSASQGRKTPLTSTNRGDIQMLNTPQIVRRVTTHQPVTQLRTVGGISNVRLASPTVLTRPPQGGVVIRTTGATQVISGVRPVLNSPSSTVRTFKVVPNSLQPGGNAVRLTNTNVTVGAQKQYKLVQPGSQIVSAPLSTTPGRPVSTGARPIRIVTVGSPATPNGINNTTKKTYTIGKLNNNMSMQKGNVQISSPKASVTTLANQSPVLVQPMVRGGARIISNSQTSPLVLSSTPNTNNSSKIVIRPTTPSIKSNGQFLIHSSTPKSSNTSSYIVPSSTPTTRPSTSGCKYVIQPTNSPSAQSLVGRTTARQVLAATGYNTGQSLGPRPRQLTLNSQQTVVNPAAQYNLVNHRSLNNDSPVPHSPSIHGPKPGSRPSSRPGTPTNGFVKQVTDRDVSRMWFNNDIKLKQMNRSNSIATMAPGGMSNLLTGSQPLEEEVEEEEEELGRAQTYEEYMPLKLHIGERHPDPVVETSSLSSVEPPDIWYKLAIPESSIDSGNLSAVQLESITYATQKHDLILPNKERAGYLIGDGAGVGKGRTIAGVIYENYLRGRKRSLWLSVSNDLRVDAERDLRDIGANKIEVYPLNKFKYAKISSHINGSVKKGCIFATYSSLIGESQSEGKYRTRFKQLVHWLGKGFDGVIVFDECHKAKNLCPTGSSKPTKTGITVLELQKRLPNARIVYASATGASEPKNMAYMTRLGMWGKGTTFTEFPDFINAIEKRGVGAMELVAMDMKLRGMYIARQLSFHGVTFRIEEIPIESSAMKVYDESVRLWVDARDKFCRAADMLDPEHRMIKSMWGQFWASHQRFFKYLCISAKVKHCVSLARDAIKNGKCVVIGLQSTGEARTLEQLEEQGGELNDFVSTAKGVLQTLIEKHFPAPDRSKTRDMFCLASIFDNTESEKKKGRNGLKRPRWDEDWSSDSDGEKNKTLNTSVDSNSSSSESDMSLTLSSSSSESEAPDSDADNFNPFGNGSDSDDDPWLKRKTSNKKPKKEKKKKEKKKKIKKKKVKKSKDRDSSESGHRKKRRRTDDSSDDEFDDIDNKMDKALSVLKEQEKKNGMKKPSITPGTDDVEQAVKMKQSLLNKLEILSDKLPPNTLDELIDQLGGTECVAEMTGRKGRVVSNEDGTVQYESRSEMDAPLEILNLTEKQRFMDGEKNIAIISEAASSGISLQADRRAINQRRRVHITLELPWSADRAIQQFGRTHRSNQVTAPEYMFLISDLAGERRFAATVAKRLESLGALTHGDRRATESRDLSRFNIDNKFGRTALEAVMKSVMSLEKPMAPLPKDYKGNFFEDVKRGLIGVGMIAYDERSKCATLEKDFNNISKFLNRILGMTVELQNHLFKYFTDTLAAVVLQAKRNGRWDLGILDLGAGTENVRRLNVQAFVSNLAGLQLKTHLNTIKVERGLTWDGAMSIWRSHNGSEDGFYVTKSHQKFAYKKTAVLVVAMVGKRSTKHRMYNVYRPNTGIQSAAEPLSDIKTKYHKVFPDEAEPLWQDQYSNSVTLCTHAYHRGHCKKSSLGLTCEIGIRCRTYYVLSGSVLGCWNKVESVLASLPGMQATRMQIIRLRTDDGQRIVGTLIPEAAINALKRVLTEGMPTQPPATTPGSTGQGHIGHMNKHTMGTSAGAAGHLHRVQSAPYRLSAQPNANNRIPTSIDNGPAHDANINSRDSSVLNNSNKRTGDLTDEPPSIRHRITDYKSDIPLFTLGGAKKQSSVLKTEVKTEVKCEEEIKVEPVFKSEPAITENDMPVIDTADVKTEEVAKSDNTPEPILDMPMFF